MPRLPIASTARPAPPAARPSPIAVETESYLIRSMRETDADGPFMTWLADAEILRGLNIPPRSWTPATLRGFIAGFDGVSRHLVGICDRKSGAMIGFYTLDINRVHRTSQLTTAIGDKTYVGRNVLVEATPAFVNYLFEKRNIDKVSARVLASNRRMLFNFMGDYCFRYEARLKQEVIAPDGKRGDILVFAALKHP